MKLFVSCPPNDPKAASAEVVSDYVSALNLGSFLYLNHIYLLSVLIVIGFSM